MTMNLNIEDGKRDWIIYDLERLKDFVEQANQPGFDWHSEGPVNLEILEHLIAMFRETKCVCGVDFSKKK